MKHRLKGINFGMYWLDFIELLACMAFSHAAINNPFYGASVYLFADILQNSQMLGITRWKNSEGSLMVSRLVVILVIVTGMLLTTLYPVLLKDYSSNLVSLLVVAIVLRNYLCVHFPGQENGGVGHWLLMGFVQLCFDGITFLILYGNVELEVLWILMLVLTATGVVKMLSRDNVPLTEDQLTNRRYDSLASYRVFSNMCLYATMATSLGAMTCLCHFLISKPDFVLGTYGGLLLWIGSVYLVFLVTSIYVRKRLVSLGIAEFIVGAIIWVLGAVQMFTVESTLGRMLWTLCWGIGITLISASIHQFSLDFAAVGKISPDNLDDDDLRLSNRIISIVSSMLTSVIMLIIMAVWSFAVPHSGSLQAPLVFDIVMMQLPVFLMLAAIFFALRQPLAGHNRERLMQYINARTRNERVRENLQRIFVRKYRMRFGTRVLSCFVIPFLRLRVSGKEHLRRQEYPSIFVCNHGAWYGPVSAVLYLPTYFRPWIHNVMLNLDSLEKEVLSWHPRLLGHPTPRWMVRIFSRMLCWALNSYDPIPVVRGNSHNVMNTFELSLQALEDGDNILIFPEQSRRDVTHPDDLRGFYTGFAHIAKMYYEHCGGALLFYPVYSNRQKHVFAIGEPVRYDVSDDPRRARQTLADTLHSRIIELSGLHR